MDTTLTNYKYSRSIEDGGVSREISLDTFEEHLLYATSYPNGHLWDHPSQRRNL